MYYTILYCRSITEANASPKSRGKCLSRCRLLNCRSSPAFAAGAGAADGLLRRSRSAQRMRLERPEPLPFRRRAPFQLRRRRHLHLQPRARSADASRRSQQLRVRRRRLHSLHRSQKSQQSPAGNLESREPKSPNPNATVRHLLGKARHRFFVETDNPASTSERIECVPESAIGESNAPLLALGR